MKVTNCNISLLRSFVLSLIEETSFFIIHLIVPLIQKLWLTSYVLV